ncbi:CBS domain-containing protein [Streptomyces antarcticus]|uniref:CBS domain-containing protein n=1 Tax=Streptomyces antarcticus TaxID=2996458 RepID=UPI00227053D4|nr:MULTISPECIES: CBS domain-containing protein [unclassified Streptomyces]MCY0939769.1 CBS domain-containing protein [Streptomyces sp. H34-AA3]MCZ4080939.1 CBS domain-containing protein [Streptomyces sp. H34-S5]
MKHIKVGDLMTDEVVSVVASTSFKDVAKLLAQHDISGLPVLDEEDRVLGVVSESDLIGRQAAEHPLMSDSPGGRETFPSEMSFTAGEVMSAPAVTVHAEETAAGAARLMAHRGIERLPVVDDEDRLVGIVTRRDLLMLFLRPDAEIRRRVVEEILTDTMGLGADAVAVHVLDGIVTLDGRLERQSQVPVLVRLTGQLEGVVGVVPRLTASVDDSLLTAPPRSPLGMPW